MLSEETLTSRFFSEEKVSEIRDRSNILEIVSDYVTLKKTGKHHKGLCPFHSEKTPSFMVNEEKQIFHCFGCGAGGDVFKFLMEIAHFSFPQAIEELAKRYGINLPPQAHTTTLITVFRPDSAGIQATLRSIPLFLGEEVEGKTITLPGGEDPDEF